MPIMKAQGREDFVRLEAGKNYFWKVETSDAKYSIKGDEQFHLVLKVGDKNGQVKIFETLTFSERAYFRIEQFLKSAGKYPGDGVEIFFDCDDVEGLSGWCTIKYEESKNGKEYARIDRWVSADKQTPDPKWIERATLNVESKAESTSNLANEWDGEAGKDDDIPF